MTHSPGNTWICYPLRLPDPVIYYFNFIDSIVRHSQPLWCPAFRFQFPGNTVSVYNTASDRKSVKRAEELCFILFLWRSIESVASIVFLRSRPFLRSTINAFRLQRWIYNSEQRNDESCTEDVVRDRVGVSVKYFSSFYYQSSRRYLYLYIFLPFIFLYISFIGVYRFEPAT